MQRKYPIIIFLILLWPALAFAAIETGTGGLVFSDETSQTVSAARKWVNVETFGADGSDGIDDTDEINDALDSGHPVFFPPGTYVVSGELSCTTAGQLISGSSPSDYVGTNLAIIQIPATCNLGDGIFVANTLSRGPAISDISIVYLHSTSATQADYVAPPAFYINDAPGTSLTNIYIQEAYDGIKIRGDADNVSVIVLEISDYRYGIDIQDATGFITLDDIHEWPFHNLDGTRTGVMQAKGSTECLIVDADATVYVGTLLDYSGNGIQIGNSGLHSPRVFFAGISPEKKLTTYIGSGTALMSHSYLQSPDANIAVPDHSVEITGGKFLASSSYFPHKNGLEPDFEMSGSAMAIFNACQFYTQAGYGGPDKHFLRAQTGTTVVLTGCYFSSNSPVGSALDNTSYTIQIESGAVATMMGCRTFNHSDAGTYPRYLLDIDADGRHVVRGNYFGYWDLNLPGGYSTLEASLNIEH